MGLEHLLHVHHYLFRANRILEQSLFTSIVPERELDRLLLCDRTFDPNANGAMRRHVDRAQAPVIRVSRLRSAVPSLVAVARDDPMTKPLGTPIRSDCQRRHVVKVRPQIANGERYFGRRVPFETHGLVDSKEVTVAVAVARN
jgi:hypothetical protein